MTNDQEHYQNLIDELHSFIKSLQEWQEQCDPEANESENQCLRLAINDLSRCLMNIDRARVRLAEYQKQQKEALLERIRTGTTTYADATLAEGFMP